MSSQGKYNPSTFQHPEAAQRFWEDISRDLRSEKALCERLKHLRIKETYPGAETTIARHDLEIAKWLGLDGICDCTAVTGALVDFEFLLYLPLPGWKCWGFVFRFQVATLEFLDFEQIQIDIFQDASLQ